MSPRAILLTLGFVAMTLVLSGCGRAGDPLRPAPGVVVMQPDAEAAPQEEGEPFILDGLL